MIPRVMKVPNVATLIRFLLIYDLIIKNPKTGFEMPNM